MGICIIIPAFNAEQMLTAVVYDALQAKAPLLVVDDGSSDRTAACASQLPVNIISHGRNLGKGAALRTGFAWALKHGFDGVVTIDADGQHDASAIPLLASTAREKGYDILIASRFSQFGQMAGLRSIWNRFGVWCMAKRTGFEITDSQSGFRYYSASLLRQVELSANGYHMEMEILMKAWRGGFRIGSIPVAAQVVDGRATSHYRAVQDTWKICMTFLKYMRYNGTR
ncbi:MAG: glycosyl transferase family [Geobacteraceae bacterium]|nr:MAG: glycosyl transferase family [Geobacteraceae bacterium]